MLAPGVPEAQRETGQGGVGPSSQPPAASASARPQPEGGLPGLWKAPAAGNWTPTCPPAKTSHVVKWGSAWQHSLSRSIRTCRRGSALPRDLQNQEYLLSLYRESLRPLVQISITRIPQEINHDGEEGAGEGGSLGRLRR